MKIWTYDELSTKARLDTDIENEDFVKFDELVGYFNEAIDEAEAEIHNIYEDYFLTFDFMPLVTGTSEYAMPADIYSNKIRGVVFARKNEIYPVRKIRDGDKFLKLADITQFGATTQYQYLIQNRSAAAGVEMVLHPTSRDTDSALIKRWYIRNANRIPLSSEGSEAATNIVTTDIPEFANFLLAYAKMRIYEKENNPLAVSWKANTEEQRKQMVDTLTNMIPDNDDIIQGDFSFYEDFYANGLYGSHQT